MSARPSYMTSGQPRLEDRIRSAAYARIILAQYEAGATQKELAARHGKSVTSIRKRLLRARDERRERLLRERRKT